MAAGAGVLFIAVLLSVIFTVSHQHISETDTYYASVGHLFVLKCHTVYSPHNVTWIREGSHNQSLPAGVEVREGLLWFLPVQMSHNGSYTCEKRDDETQVKMKFRVSVSNEKCPEPLETKFIRQGVNGGLPCKQEEIFRLNDTRNVRWMKDCHSVERKEKSISVNDKGFMKLYKASEGDAGKYTCLVDITLDGREYTAARSIQLRIKNGLRDTVFPEPQVVKPHQDVVVVEVGKSEELECLAYIGFTEDSEVLVYWTINSAFIDDYEGCSESCRYTNEKGRVNRLCILSISKVRREFLNIPFRCHVRSPADEKIGLLWLQEADRSAFHIIIALCLTASLSILVLVPVFLFFKVDVLLAYRDLSRHCTHPQAPDGKFYDAYVCFFHPSGSSEETMSFVMQLLPEELEKKHGYSLYIRGRDDSPGEAVHDVIAATVRQCCKLIFIMQPEAEYHRLGNKERELLSYNSNQLCFEQKIGIHDALIKNDPKAILVEIGPVDYSCLPESLSYIKRKQGSLMWRNPSNGTNSLNKWYSNRNFWKNMRYNMPAVPTRRAQTAV